MDLARVAHNLPSLPAWAKRCITFFVGGEPSAFFLPAPMMTHLRARGCAVWALGCNSEEAVRG